MPPSTVAYTTPTPPQDERFADPAAEIVLREKRYSPAKLAAFLDVVTEAGLSAEVVLAGTDLDTEALANPFTLTSSLQFLTAARNAVRLDRRSDLGVRLGRRMHVSSYGMYGYALLCSEAMAGTFDTAVKYHQLANGLLDIRWVEQDDAATADRLSVAGLKMRATGNIDGVQWGKLLVNLNNALNALSDLPLRRQLAQRAWRGLFADQMAEGLAAIKADRIRPVSSTPVPAGLTPYLLRLPDGIFNVLLGSTMKIDPEARSSMWEDLQRGRATEIDYLQGVIVEIADRHGLPVPLSRRVVALVRDAEAAGKGPPRLTPEQIRIPSALQTQEYR